MKLQLRHPRDEAPLREFEDQRLDRPNQAPEAADVVKQSFIAEVTKLELWALVIGWTGRVDERERSPPNPAPLLVDCAALVHPTEDDWSEG
ncbi:hypothetical protein CKO23_18810 [Thiocystis violacea]|nr:hypothetical protein [Thiocystis violacea]